MTPYNAGIAIGGPKDRLYVSNSEKSFSVIDTSGDVDVEVFYDLHELNGCGFWLVRGKPFVEALQALSSAYVARPKDLGDVVKEAIDAGKFDSPAHGGGEKAGGPKFFAVAIGGPNDGHMIGADTHMVDIPTEDGGRFTYGWHSVAGVYYWTSPNQLMPLSKIMRMLVDRYGQFRDFAAGRTQEAMQTMSDRITELQEINLKLEQRHTDDADAKSQLRTIRSMCRGEAGVDDGQTIAGMVRAVITELKRQRQAVDLRETDRRNFVARLWGALTGQAVSADASPSEVTAIEEDALSNVIDVKDELKSTGHKHEGRTLAHLVDIAIDTERERHGETLTKIAAAAGISFAIGAKYENMRDTLVAMLETKYRAKPVTESKLGGAGAEPPLAALERRVTALENRPITLWGGAGNAGGRTSGGGGGPIR